MNFDELGAALRAERERRGLRIEDAADRLKISVRHLRALEEGDAASLPHPAYARGFIRSYAAYLGISPDEIHTAFQVPASTEAKQPTATFAPETVPERSHGSGSAIFILILILLAAGGYAGWRWGLPLLTSIEKQRLAQPSPPLSSAKPAPVTESARALPKTQPLDAAKPLPSSQPPVTAQPEPKPETPRPAPAQTPPQVENPRLEATRPADPASSGQERTEKTPSATRKEAAAQAPDAEETNTPGQHKIIITATEECWIHSNADKTDTRQFSLRKGDTFALTFARSLELKLGNAGGVRIRYDGQSLPPAGQSGQVRTLTFPPPEGQ